MNLSSLDEARFWRNVDIKGRNDCWEWTAGKNDRGYGKLQIRPNILYAHRVSYQLKNGVIPPNMCVLHKCDNPSCVNPEHLFLGDRMANRHDADMKGRSPKGSTHGCAVLDEWQVRFIKMWCELGHKNADVAKAFHISRSQAWRIRKGIRWSHIHTYLDDNSPPKEWPERLERARAVAATFPMA